MTLSGHFAGREPEEVEGTCVGWSFMCKVSGEDVDHLLLHCRVASRL